MGWTKLIDYKEERVWLGSIFWFPADYPFEGQVVMMLHLSDWDSMMIRLITITEHSAGAFCFSIFPPHADYVIENGNIGISTKWIIDNWNYYLFEETNVNQIWIKESLEVDDIQS